jgi:nucleotide-binding universal stress UspA family protein
MGAEAKIDRILVPLDDSEQARAAYGFALDLASRVGAEILIVHSVEPPTVLYDRPEFAEVLVDVTRQGEAQWQERLGQLAAEAGDVKVRSEAVVGPAAPLLLELIEREKPDLVISGSHGVSGIKMMLGSVSRRLLAHSASPLLLFREPPPAVTAGVPQIVVAVDDSPHSARALALAERFAEAFEANLHLVHVIDTYLPSYGTIDTLALVEQIRRRGREIMDEALAGLSLGEGRVTDETVEGDPGDELVKICRERHPLLVACGTRGVHGVAGLLVGSVARDLVNHAEAPVLVARAPEDA